MDHNPLVEFYLNSLEFWFPKAIGKAINLSHSLPFAWLHHKCSQHFARKPKAGPSSQGFVIQQSDHDTELNQGRDTSLFQQHGRQLATTTLSEREILWLQRSSGTLRREWVDPSTLQTFSNGLSISRYHLETRCLRPAGRREGPRARAETKEIKKYGLQFLYLGFTKL